MSRLSRIVGERRLKLKRIARDTGLAYNTVAGLYHDRSHRYDGPVIDTLCAYLGVGVGELLEHVPEERASAPQRVRTAAELTGSDPDCTGGLGTEEDLRRLRSGQLLEVSSASEAGGRP